MLLESHRAKGKAGMKERTPISLIINQSVLLLFIYLVLATASHVVYGFTEMKRSKSLQLISL